MRKGLISEIKKNGAPGWDEISIQLFLELPNEAITVLCECINLSFCKGVFPERLKQAVVVPLFKGGNHDQAESYRPIALLPMLSKIIERLVKKRMNEFLLKHSILNSRQFGFQADKSTNDAVFSFLEHLYLGLNDGEASAAVFCDLSKAFDCVDHDILLHKLERYGFRGNALKWFNSFISNRFQRVSFNGAQSEQQVIRSGVPQGSVLGPILFLLYINDLTNTNISGKFTLFADDATILWQKTDENLLNEVMASDIEIIKSWCDANRLSLNIKKTNIVSFGCNLGNIFLNGSILGNLSENKFLGIFIDSRLKFESHVISLKNKLASNCYAIRVMSNELPVEVVKNAYFALIESHVRYGICFWGTCSQQLFQSVFVLQKRAIRCVFGAKLRLM